MNGLRRMDIKFLRGIGPKRAELLEKNLGIKTYYDLLFHFPTHYIDRRSIYHIIDFAGDDMPSLQVKAANSSVSLCRAKEQRRALSVFF